MSLPRCFFDLAINGVPTGRIVFELYVNRCPRTCENFRCLCTGEKGEGNTTFKPLHYKGTPVHRIVKGFIVQGGDFVNGDGTGGESIYGGLFDDENLKLKHDQKFLLSMANKGPNTNGSQFFITTRPAPHLDGIHVVFGRVVSGQQFVVEMENQKVDTSHRPYADVRIVNCGELVLMKKGKIVKPKEVKESTSESESSDESSEESSSSSSEEERRRRKRRKRKHKTAHDKKKKRRGKDKRSKHHRNRRRYKKRDSSSSSDSDSDEEQENDGEQPVTSTVGEEELPPDISTTTHSWLYRHSRSPSPRPGEEKRKSQLEQSLAYVERKDEVSHSGRKLRGRGFMRYRTPPRDGSDFTSHMRSRDAPPTYSRRRYSRSRSRSRSREREYRYRRRRRSYSRERGSSCDHRHHHSSRSPRGRSRRFNERNSMSPERRSSKHSERRREGSRSSSPQSSHRRFQEHRPDQDRSDRETSPSRRRMRRTGRDSSSSPSPRRSRSREEKASGSKWARHRDSRSEDSDSGSDKDHELEHTYQKAERALAEQQFGIDDLLPQ